MTRGKKFEVYELLLGTSWQMISSLLDLIVVFRVQNIKVLVKIWLSVIFGGTKSVFFENIALFCLAKG